MNLENLINEYYNLQSEEARIKNTKKNLAIQIARLMNNKTEGTVTENISGLKVSVSKKLTRKLDHDSYLKIVDSLPENTKCVDYKPSINLKKLRILEALDMELVSQFITTLEATPSVKIVKGDAK